MKTSQKPIKKVFEKPGSSHFWVIFYMSLELAQLTSKDVVFVSLLPCLSAWRKKIKMVHVYSFLRYL